MSVPVSICLLSRAAASEKAYQRVLERMRYNLECGAFSFWLCTHDPKCPMPSDADGEKLMARLQRDLLRTRVCDSPARVTDPRSQGAQLPP